MIVDQILSSHISTVDSWPDSDGTDHAHAMNGLPANF